MSDAGNTSPAAEPVIGHRELHAGEGKTTILLIHGALATGDEWDLATPHLSPEYHLLLPDLPGHGRSKDILPLSKDLAARFIADLIRQKALDEKAHIVGFSFGAHIAVELISKHPDVVNAVFISGYEVFSSAQPLAYALWLQGRLPSLLPRAVRRWLMDGADINGSDATTSTLEFCRTITNIMCIDDTQWPSPWPARTLIVAASKSGLLPTADHPDDAKRLRDIASQVQPEGQTMAYTHPEMRHPWNRQAPELFATTARMWFAEGKVPDGFKEL